MSSFYTFPATNYVEKSYDTLTSASHVRCNGPCNKIKACLPFKGPKLYCRRCAVSKGLWVDEPASNTTESKKDESKKNDSKKNGSKK